jgi:hypothetical protein
LLEAVADDRRSGQVSGVIESIEPDSSTTAHNTPVRADRGNEIVSGPPLTPVAANAASRRGAAGAREAEPTCPHPTPPPDTPSTVAGESSPGRNRTYATRTEDGSGAIGAVSIPATSSAIVAPDVRIDGTDPEDVLMPGAEGPSETQLGIGRTSDAAMARRAVRGAEVCLIRSATPALPRGPECSRDRSPQLSFGHPERGGEDL